jgi:hypothetical protein
VSDRVWRWLFELYFYRAALVPTAAASFVMSVCHTALSVHGFNVYNIKSYVKFN